MQSLLNLLQNRHSFPASQLTEPAPDDEQLEQILRCAVAAPDHARLRPWRFIVIRGEGRKALADAFVEAAMIRDPDISQPQLDKLAQKPLRSPLIVVVVADITANHPKTPEIEQTLSAGAAIQLMQLGATAAGFGSIWLTGANAYDEHIKSKLKIDSKDQIVGFLYIGTAPEDTPPRKRPAVQDHLSYWPA
ncbi:MAG: nitroreductase [Granulosicoccus sp.]|nr:nitroreductase [Granulosicoccus sp.]